MKQAMLQHRTLSVSLNNLRFSVLYDASFFNFVASRRCAFHGHYVFELHWLLSGRGSLETEGGVWPVAGVSGILIGRDVPHLLKSDSEEPLFRCIFGFDYEPSAEAERDPFILALKECPLRFLAADGEMNRLVLALRRELEQRDSMMIQRAQAYLTLIFCRLSCLLPQGAAAPLKEDPNGDAMSSKTFTVMDGFFSGNIDQAPPARELEELLHVSNRQLQRIMLRYFGMGFQKKLVQSRIMAAKYLLLNTEQSEEEIAQQCGYAYLSGFCKAFRRVAGVTPLQFRKAARLEQKGPAVPRREKV